MTTNFVKKYGDKEILKGKKEEVRYRETIKEFFDDIVNIYNQFEAEKRIMLYDAAEKEILPFPYTKFKSALMSKESQELLEKEYQKSLITNKILIVVSDSKCQKIKTCSIDKTSRQQVDTSKFKTIF